MGFIVNPLGLRLTRTKFSKFCWINISKKNYKKNFFEDNIFEKIINWLKFFFNFVYLNVSIINFSIIKYYKFIYLNFFILIRRKKKKRKKFINFYKYLNNNYFSYIFLKKIFFNYFSYNIKYKKIFKFINIKKTIKKILRRQNKKNKKYLYKKKFLINLFFFKKNINCVNFFKKFNFLNFFYNKKKNFFIFKKLKKKFFNLNFFFLKSFILFLLNNIFFNKNIFINFLNQKEFFISSSGLKTFIEMRVAQKYKVLHIVNLLFNKLNKNNNVVGIEIGLFGRYQKKLRNKKVWKLKGLISPCNLNSPVSYKNFAVLLRNGICGIKLYLVMKVYKNEIF